MPVNNVIHFSDASLIAVHALAGLAAQPGMLVQTRELASAIGASEHHLAKVMQRLVKAGLARSVKGPAGGFSLAKEADAITFLQTIESVDGPVNTHFCPFSTENCSPDNCIFGSEISEHSKQLMEYLDKRSIGDIARGTTLPSLTPAMSGA